MARPIFQKISILGLGLIGGCVALDVQDRGLAKTVVGYNRSPKRRRLAKKLGACDEVTGNPKKAVADADLVILATPVRTIVPLARQIATSLKPNALVTDVGSTKYSLVKQLSKIFKTPVDYIGSHPIAGTEYSGIESSFFGLFEDRWWLMTPHSRSARAKRALKRLTRFAKALGAKTANLNPKAHDATLAAISHLPHMVAYAMVDTVGQVKQGKSLKYAAGGFRDYTRIAASSPQMWSEICMENTPEILKMIRRFQASLKQIQKHLEKKDLHGLHRFFEKTANVRRKL